MKILFLPILVILAPLFLLGFILAYWKRLKSISIGWKVALGFAFVILGALTSVCATFISMKGMLEANIKCLTGIIIFVPYGVITYIIGVPLLFFIHGLMQKNNYR